MFISLSLCVCVCVCVCVIECLFLYVFLEGSEERVHVRIHVCLLIFNIMPLLSIDMMM